MLEPRPYFQILHSLCAVGELDWDAEDNLERIQWVKRNWSRLKRCMSSEERGLLRLYMCHHEQHGEVASVRDLDALLRSMPQNAPMLDLLRDYEKDHKADLEVLPASSLSVSLGERESDWDRARVQYALTFASHIVNGSMQDAKDKTKFWTGPADALKYLSMEMQAGLLLDHREVVGGDTATAGVDSLLERFDSALAGRTGQIMTGFQPLDDALSIGHTQGCQIKELLMAGFSGHGKSTFLFNAIYNAAAQGFRVLLVPRECSVEQAWDRFVYLHAAATGRARELPRMKKFLRPGFAKPQHRAVFQAIKADMIASGIRIDVLGLNTWDEVERAVEAHVQDPYDILAVDYLAHLQPPAGTRTQDTHTAILDTFRKAQALTQNYEKNRGLVVMSPMQTNKTAADAAGQGLPYDKGVYTGIGCLEQYTGAGRDADALIGIWSDDWYKSKGLSKVCCIKSRDDVFEPFFIRLDPHTEAMHFVRNAEAITLLGVPPTGLPDDNESNERTRGRSKKRRAAQTTTPNNNRIEDAEVL